MKLETFSYQLNQHTPLRDLLDAELDRQAALTLRNPEASQNARTWANQQLNGQLINRVPLALLLTNPTIAAAVASGTTPPDADIQYVVTNEILPVIVPPEPTPAPEQATE